MNNTVLSKTYEIICYEYEVYHNANMKKYLVQKLCPECKYTWCPRSMK